MSPSIRFLMTTGLGKKRALSCSVTYQFHIQKCNAALTHTCTCTDNPINRFTSVPLMSAKNYGGEIYHRWGSTGALPDAKATLSKLRKQLNIVQLGKRKCSGSRPRTRPTVLWQLYRSTCVSWHPR